MTLTKSNSITWMTILALFLSACQTPSNHPLFPKWEIADLRIVTAPDQVPPTFDAIALYTRTLRTDLQIRIDFLDLDLVSNSDIYLAFDTRSGGNSSLPGGTNVGLAWDILVVIPASGTPLIFKSQPISVTNQIIEEGFSRLIPRTVRDPWNDFVIVNLNKSAIPETNNPFRLQVFITPPDSAEVIDRLGPVLSENPPPGRVPILLAFWNVFPALTPAQALRHWDGAHTGPLGERHGLKPLWERFSPGWEKRYSSIKTSRGWIWRIKNGPQVEINSTASLSFSPFNEWRLDQKSTEDPNFEYPRGYFLPFPVALFEAKSEGDFSMELQIGLAQDPSSITSK